MQGRSNTPQEITHTRVHDTTLYVLTCVCLCVVAGLSVGCGKNRQVKEHPQNLLYESQPALDAKDRSAGRDKKTGTPLPKLNQLAQADEPKDTPFLDSGVVAAAVLTRVWLPADQTINNLWREVSTTSLSDAELLVWHRNQLRAAVVGKDKLNEMLARLPAHFGVQQQIMTLSGDLIALDPANSKAAHRPVSLEMDGVGKVYSGGRMQLLVAANPQDGKAVKLTFVPHQYQPRVTLLPRPHAQSVLDGVMFSKLMLRVLISPGQVLLIAPDVPLPVFDDTRPVVSDKTETAKQAPVSTTQPSGVEAGEGEVKERDVNQVLELPAWSTEPEARRVPYGFGQAVLTGYQGRSELYQLLILEVQPVSAEASSGVSERGMKR